MGSARVSPVGAPWIHRVRWPTAVCLAAILLLSLLAGWLVYSRVVLLDLPPGWDEAGHALFGALIAHDLRAGDVPALVFDLYRQVYWPPIHPALLGVAFLAGGTTIETARLVSVLAFVPIPLVLFLTARVLVRENPNVAGLVVAGLALSSPALLEFASMNMLEIPGILALSLTILAWIILDRAAATPATWQLVGVGVVITYLVKSNYGILLLLAIAATELLVAGGRPRRLLTRRNLHILIPIAAFVVLWFAWPWKLSETWKMLVNVPMGAGERNALMSLLIFPYHYVKLAGSPATAVLLAAALLYSWRWKHDRSVALLFVVAVLQFAIAEAHHTKIDRHILPMFPVMFLLCGFASARLWSRIGSRWYRYATGGALLTLIALPLGSLSVGRQAEHYATPDVTAHAAALARANTPALIVGLHEARPRILEWNLITMERLFPVVQSGAAMNPRRDRQLAERITNAHLPRWIREEAQRVFRRYDALGSTHSLYHFGTGLPRLDGTLRAIRPCAIVSMVDVTGAAGLSPAEPEIERHGFRYVSERVLGRPGERLRIRLYRLPAGCD